MGTGYGLTGLVLNRHQLRESKLERTLQLAFEHVSVSDADDHFAGGVEDRLGEQDLVAQMEPVEGSSQTDTVVDVEGRGIRARNTIAEPVAHGVNVIVCLVLDARQLATEPLEVGTPLVELVVQVTLEVGESVAAVCEHDVERGLEVGLRQGSVLEAALQHSDV